MKVLCETTEKTMLEHDGRFFFVNRPYYVNEEGYKHYVYPDSLYGTILSEALLKHDRRMKQEGRR